MFANMRKNSSTVSFVFSGPVQSLETFWCQMFQDIASLGQYINELASHRH